MLKIVSLALFQSCAYLCAWNLHYIIQTLSVGEKNGVVPGYYQDGTGWHCWWSSSGKFEGGSDQWLSF